MEQDVVEGVASPACRLEAEAQRVDHAGASDDLIQGARSEGPDEAILIRWPPAG
jgi:hypothetical protein